MTTVDETPIVSTTVGQKSTPDLIIPTPQPSKLLKRKRETAQATDEKKFPSLIGFIIQENINEYLETKARQARIRAKVECKDQGDEAILERREFLLNKVKQIAEYASELNKEVSSLFPETEQRNELRKEYLAYIMKEKFYSAEETEFKDWPIIALKLEADRIEKIKLDPRKKKTAPNWNKYNKFIADLISEHKRKKQELVDGKLEKQRLKASNPPKKSDYKKLQEQVKIFETQNSTAEAFVTKLRKEKKEMLSAGEEKNKEADQIEEAMKKIASDKERLAKLQALAKKVKVVSQKSSAGVTNSELLDKEVEADIATANKIIEQAFIRVDEDDSSSKEFEEEFKRKAKELLMKNKDPD
ncbi:uncharacterized protein LOC118488920 [Helianthus annuus]|uniref:uncharacterized protein LOC118488920 n=1 Tax=Helianthus annuus TaxID=4232 RepID=UPI001652BCA0|nr:uncharacterized protein LOC118488920 [Helianthus annuus]